ncbi:MAG TPA: hypothetical protein DDZ83_05665 [Nitrospinae bacterium]|nr:hypothetical protein [Nitrospinota bacterium]
MSAARRRGLENLGGIFTQLRRSEKWGRHLSSHAVFRVWEDAVGEALAKVARPVSLRGGTLRVEVSDPAWMQELHLMSGDILAKIKEALEGEDIENIRFQAGGGAAAESAGIDRSGHSRYVSKVPPPEAVVSSGDRIAIREALETFDDPELRESVEHLMERMRNRVPGEEMEKPKEWEKRE